MWKKYTFKTLNNIIYSDRNLGKNIKIDIKRNEIINIILVL